jgi:hypothetical protein
MAWRFGSKCSGHYYWFKRLFRVAGVGQLLAAQSSQRFQPDHHTDALSRERKRQWVNNPLFQRVPLPSAERQRSIFVLLIIIQESRPMTATTNPPTNRITAPFQARRFRQQFHQRRRCVRRASPSYGLYGFRGVRCTRQFGRHNPRRYLARQPQSFLFC